MISQLRLENFKCFSDASIPLSALTLLAGTNASGKSTTIQALLLLRQSHLKGVLTQGELLLSGSLANIGTVGDALNEGATNDEITFSVTEENGSQNRFTFQYEAGKRTTYTLNGVPNPDYDTQMNVFASQFNYLNAERVGPRPLYALAKLPGSSTDLGIHGEYAADVLARHRDIAIACKELAYGDEEAREIFRTVGSQTRLWMQTIVPNFDYTVEELTGADQVQVMLRTRTANYVRPTNIGFGIIYALPIIVGALVAPAGSLLIVENPEAHLHPAGQSQIGMFLARVAAAGVQVVIETHSDHVVNGIRRMVRNQTLRPEQVAISFFNDMSRIVTPRIYEDGGIDPWPDGFFDQIEKDLRELF